MEYDGDGREERGEKGGDGRVEKAHQTSQHLTANNTQRLNRSYTRIPTVHCSRPQLQRYNLLLLWEQMHP
jgi:hypothetical protein